MDSATESSDQVRQNYDAYNEHYRADLEQTHWGKTAVMHDGEVVLILNNSDDAYTVGQKQYGVGNFSIVRIGAPPTRLGVVGTLIG